MFALPGIEMRRSIEVNGFALASIHDERVQELADQHPNFKEFLGRFTTEFGQPLVPSILSAATRLPGLTAVSMRSQGFETSSRCALFLKAGPAF
jgi:hypothetical protein